jgi:hypothetical protein
MGWVDPETELAQIRAWFTARDLELELFEKSDGAWRAMITAPGEARGTSEYVDGGDALEVARLAQRRHSTRQLRLALDGLSQVAQSEVVQLLAAELLISRMPGGRSRLGRKAALASAVWMLDPRRRSATRTVGRMAGEWARLRVSDRRAGDTAQRQLLPSALGATERQLDKLRLRLRGG